MQTSIPTSSEASQDPKSWTAEEQSLLEKAMKQFPASAYKGAERWDKVASMIPTRTKKEVLQRVKEIVQNMKAKK
jgi:hypothetical protein